MGIKAAMGARAAGGLVGLKWAGRAGWRAVRAAGI